MSLGIPIFIYVTCFSVEFIANTRQTPCPPQLNFLLDNATNLKYFSEQCAVTQAILICRFFTLRKGSDAAALLYSCFLTALCWTIRALLWAFICCNYDRALKFT